MRALRRANSIRGIAAILLAGIAAAGCGSHVRDDDPGPGGAGGGDWAREGRASWYGRAFHGKRTANGERYDVHALTAAHRSLPFGTILEVTRVDTGEKVKVRINDRGPYAKGRILDLSRAAAERLRMLDDGVARVRLRVVSRPRDGKRAR